MLQIMWNGLKIGIVFLVVFLPVSIYLTQTVKLIWVTPSTSMDPTIRPNSFTVFQTYNHQFVRRGDIIAFTHPDSGSGERLVIKRVIGLPGEAVEIREGVVYIDGERYNENYLSTPLSGEDQIFLVQEDSYFVMGDNREHSIDSRYWENPFVTRQEIRGIKKQKGAES